MTTSEATTRRRVKLYMLNGEREWDDKGTGHVSAICSDDRNMSLMVISESDGSALLNSKIRRDTAYHRQQETLIVWSEGDLDLALSFQENSGCGDIWEKICKVQGKDPSVDVTQEVVDESDDCDDSEGNALSLSQGKQNIDLPPCELSHLEEITDLVNQCAGTQTIRDKFVEALEKFNYLPKLVTLFHKAESQNNMDALQQLFDIIRRIILFNNHNLYEILFSDNMIMDVIGMLEYNPSGRQCHREFLINKATFKEVLPLQNSELLSKIHQTYRVQYIQDCCLPPPCLFDDNTLSSLKSFISSNKIEIIRTIQENEEFLQKLFMKLRKPDISVTLRRDLAMFAKEFCTLSVQTEQKDHALQCMHSHGALKTLEILLKSKNRETKSAALDILQAFVEHQASYIREYVYQESGATKDQDNLINIMIKEMINDTDPEMSDAYVLCYMLRIVIDPDNMTSDGPRGGKTEFLSFFYKNCIPILTNPLFELTEKDELARDDYHTALVMHIILELMIFCIENHAFQMRNYCFNRDFIKNVMVLLKSNHKFLVLCALRLFRRIISMKEDFYYRYIIKNCLFKPILDLFYRNGHRYNLIDSAIIELFEFIRAEEIQLLIVHIVGCYYDKLRRIDYVQTFEGLKQAYNEMTLANGVRIGHNPGSLATQPQLNVLQLVSNANSSAGLGARSVQIGRYIDTSEEQWLEQSDEEDDQPNGVSDQGSSSPSDSTLSYSTNSIMVSDLKAQEKKTVAPIKPVLGSNFMDANLMDEDQFKPRCNVSSSDDEEDDDILDNHKKLPLRPLMGNALKNPQISINIKSGVLLKSETEVDDAFEYGDGESLKEETRLSSTSMKRRGDEDIIEPKRVRKSSGGSDADEEDFVEDESVGLDTNDENSPKNLDVKNKDSLVSSLVDYSDEEEEEDSSEKLKIDVVSNSSSEESTKDLQHLPEKNPEPPVDDSPSIESCSVLKPNQTNSLETLEECS